MTATDAASPGSDRPDVSRRGLDLSGIREPTQAPVRFVRHNRIDLAIHELDAGDDSVRPLLLLHGLGERTPAVVPTGIDWAGPVFGLDFTGHGRSTQSVGGGYSSEVLVGDVDAALRALGAVTVLGRGLGAYIGLLVAAARPELVRGAVLADGPGLVGGGVHPGSPTLPYPPAAAGGPPDPYALIELSRDTRPADYAATFAGFAVEGSDLDPALWVSAVVRPEWLAAVAEHPDVATGSVVDGLAHFASVV